MPTPRPVFDVLPRAALLPVALETMHVGHLIDRALMPAVAIAAKSVDAVDDVAIDEWMGASPVYTGRMRALMGIEGDGVDAIMKALQLDVGFPHQYMDVGWRIRDAQHGEFWLLHFGALMDTERHGERRVIGMCHKIEDPTFDATAYATNPRARIRPIHRPPRVPADRVPHCHWTIEIDPANEPVGPARHTRSVAELPIATVANAREAEASPAGRTDYRGDFDPRFRLGDLSTATLAAVATEFQIQVHLLASSAELALTARLGREPARAVLEQQWIAVAWVAGQRLARALGVAHGGAPAVAAALRLHAALPPGFARRVEADGSRVQVELAPESPALLDPEQPGWIGLLARGAARRIEAAAQAVDPRARARDLALRDGRIALELSVDAATAPAEAPKEAAFMGLSTATGWVFDTSEARLGR